jgi:hypothetical protein
MFIRAVVKKDKSKQKSYTYYRLTHSYRVGNKTRQVVVLNLGKLEGLEKELHKLLANRIEELVTGIGSGFIPIEISSEVESLAQSFAKQISKEKIFSSDKGQLISQEVQNNFQRVDLESLEQLESNEIGGEWLVKQAFEAMDIPSILATIGLDAKQVKVAQMLLTAKLLHPSSELETQRWLDQNSACAELFDYQEDITRYSLYQVATKMYCEKENIDNSLYSKTADLFSNRNKIVIYDLTNMYFEGQMNGSDKAAFGRSKQKRSDRKLIGLSLAIDSNGFVRHSQFYTRNISEPSTFKDLIRSVSEQMKDSFEKPLVVMDAGISTEENLALLKSKDYNYDYVCVSRVTPKNFTKLSENAETITDNRGNEIHLTKVAVPGKEDHYLQVKSDQKKLKEQSMDTKLTLRLEEQLEDIKQKLPKKGTLKKRSKIHEKVGAIKSKLSGVGWLYEIEYTEDQEKDIVTDINWKRIKEKEKPKGEYFLRYTKTAIEEDKIWDAYNLTRDIEAVFRCLKTDLNIRPIHHQKDKYIEPHIWLGIISYQVVNYIRENLKKKGINHSWTKIVDLMKSMQSSLNTINNDKNEKLYIKLCTRPTKTQKEIFDALNFKARPYTRKTKVVTQL